MAENVDIERFLRNLPDVESARRFFNRLQEIRPAEANKLLKDPALLSDVLAIASYSPLLATTLLQNTPYIAWLKRQRAEQNIREGDELLESLARMTLTNSETEPQLLLARFRRRELLRIYLRDIRRLGTISEITVEISNLADAVLEHALRFARQELDNRFGVPLETDEKGKSKQAQFSIVSLGKLGSRELNYSSDIDLIYLYSADGITSGTGSRGSITNREYFIKLAELVTKTVGQQTGEGAAYRVDLRLRPHGRVGSLAVSLNEAIKYYQTSAQPWERQTLIRAHSSAGSQELFKDFYSQVESSIYSPDETVANALRNVRLSKEKINLEHHRDGEFNVKLDKGGIREIEFISQALQLAHGGNDVWIREPHTLISLSRLADRELLTETEITQLSEAYEFLRRIEHHLQMEHGLQTHIIPTESAKHLLIAEKMGYRSIEDFDASVQSLTSNVYEIFKHIFGDAGDETNAAKLPETEVTATEFLDEIHQTSSPNPQPVHTKAITQILSSLEKSKTKIKLSRKKLSSLERFCQTSLYFTEFLTNNPSLVKRLPDQNEEPAEKDYLSFLSVPVAKEKNLAGKMSALRQYWSKAIIEIAAFDVYEKIERTEAKRKQTALAEASIKTALTIAEFEAKERYELSGELHFAVLGLGKLGGRGMDYGSDLDLVLVYDDEQPSPVEKWSHAEFYARFVDLFVSALSSFTRDGNLYRVDLRLRPDGRNGATSLGKNAFLNYLQNRADIWEWLAYVKLRAVAGKPDLAFQVDEQARRIIHGNALTIEKTELKMETRRVRERLEQEKAAAKRVIDIKFGAGGMLDVYFSVRYLQLRDHILDEGDNRSTLHTLKRLCENDSLTTDEYQSLSEGYTFLSILDHNLRLSVGRSNTLPLGNHDAMQIIIKRMGISSVNELLERLTMHRLNIRNAFESIFG